MRDKIENKNKTESSSHLNEGKGSNDVEEVNIYPQKKITDIDRRLENIEKMMGVAENVAEKAIETWENNQKRKSENELKDLLYRNEQHKRTGNILIGIILAIFILCLVSMFMKQFDLVKLILSSSLAVGAGAGLTSFLQRRSKEK